MASYNHHPYHSCHHPASSTSPAPTTTTSCCYCCCYYTTYTPSHHPLPPDTHPPSMSPHLHHHPQPHLFSPYTPLPHQHHPSQLHPQTQSPLHFQEMPHRQEQQELTHPLIISSLFRRISSLEAALKRYSSYSLRDAAARTIQTHFRAFLVRRSRTLGQLKVLASIKSTLTALRSSVCENAQFGPQAISLKAMHLLLKLDSIQGGDPMVSDGKRSISRELNQFVELIDGVSVKRGELSRRIIKDFKCGRNGKTYGDFSIGKRRANVDSVKSGRHGDVVGKLREQIERTEGMYGLGKVSEDDAEYDEEVESPAFSLARGGVPINGSCGMLKGNTGVPAKTKRTVRLVEDGNAYTVFGASREPASSGNHDTIVGSDSVVEGKLIGNLSTKVEEVVLSSKKTVSDDVEAQTEDEGSSQSSYSDKDVNYTRKSIDDVDQMRHNEGEGGKFIFSAPLPVKMEPRADFINKRKS